jgi:hypothetical protein
MGAGLHLPNRRLQEGELEAILALGCLVYVVYLFDLSDEAIAYWVGVAREIRRRQPKARFNVRIERRGALDVAGDVALLRRVVVAFGDLACIYRIRNEPNKESPGVTPQEWGDYIVAFARALDPYTLAVVSVPAVSPDPATNWLAWLDATIDGAERGGYIYVDAHAYGGAGEVRAVLEEYRRRCQRWALIPILTETNFGAGRQYDVAAWARELPRILEVCDELHVEGRCVFIWSWKGPDMALPTSVDVRGTVIADAIREANQVAPTVPHEEDRPMLKEAKLGGLAVYDLRDRFPEVQGRRFPVRELSAIRRVVVHHTVTRSPREISDALALLDEIQRYHTTNVNPKLGMPWPAIGYHFGLDAETRLYWLNGFELVSYHAGEANGDSIGLAVLGDFSKESPAAHVQDQVRRVHAELEGYLDRKLELIGHRDVDPGNVCPGVWWPAFRAQGQPGEVPAEWRQYGRTWPEVAGTLKGIATDALEAGRVLRDRLTAIGAQASQSAEAWGNR